MPDLRRLDAAAGLSRLGPVRGFVHFFGVSERFGRSAGSSAGGAIDSLADFARLGAQIKTVAGRG